MTTSAAFTAHASAEIAEGARVGDGTRIWQNCIILSGARIGMDCKLAHNVFVEGGVNVGDRVTVKDNVALYDGLAISDDVFIGPNAVFTNVLQPRAFVSRKQEFLDTRIGTGATVGANATILCGTTIGDYAMVGAGAVVTRDVPAFALVAGNPARPMGWVSRAGIKLDEALTCPQTGERYLREGDGLKIAT